MNNKIWIFYKSEIDLHIVDDTEQALHCTISSSSLQTECLLSLVYAKCTKRERLCLWDNLRSMIPANSPWLVGVDFNVISNATERIGGSTPDIHAMSDFANCILDTGLIDIGFSGPCTT